MITSMTGYGRAENLQGEMNCVLEIRSVNHRFLDLSLRVPKRYQVLGDFIKKNIKKNFSRGSFDISLTFDVGENGNEQSLKPNLALARQYLQSVETLKKELNLEGQVSLDSILSMKDILCYDKDEESVETLMEILEPTLHQTMEALKQMRAAEGEALFTEISQRIGTIREKLENIKKEQPKILEAYRDRLSEQIKRLAGEINIDPGRIAQEAAIFAERADVSEETLRLQSHLDQFTKHLKDGGTVGRKLDFILQEMNRETNTLSSKVPDHSCSNEAIEIKCELEKIREQVQNVE